jgi:hypothetical protein
MKAKDLDKDVWKRGVWRLVDNRGVVGEKEMFSKKEHCV